MSRLLDEETEADEQFWGQDAFKEDVEDAEYEAEEEVVDEFDSDFDEDEMDLEDEAEEDDDERYRVKKKKFFPPGKKISKNKKNMSAPKTKGLAFIEAAVAAATDSNHAKPKSIPSPAKQSDVSSELHENFVDLEGERIVRKSTRTAVVVRQAERDALRAALQATIKPVKKKREGEERRITQEEMLLEAAQTEIMNRQNLEKMLAREEEVKQKAIVHKTVYSGPQIRFYSRDGKNILEFIRGATFSKELFGQAKPYPKRPVCVITGLPAKYVDPFTGLPYATKEASKIIRERVDREDNFSQRSISETPWKRARTRKSISGHVGVTKSRRYKLHGTSHVYESPQPSATQHISTSPINFGAKGEIASTHLLEPSPSQELTGSEVISKAGDQSSSQPPAVARTTSEEHLTAEDTALKYESVLQLDGTQFPSKPHSQASLLENFIMPRIWVDIPPPREEPTPAEFMLDDLVPLDFGPLLSLQHGSTGRVSKGLEIDLEKSPSGGPLLPSDVLRMSDLGEMKDFL